jgi:uncharacterized protein YdhG (YjbR/CyaY superfamily)
MPTKTRTPASIDDYLSRLDSDKRTALERLRRSIRAAAPKAVECISYGIPAFRLDGRVLVWLGAATNHCSFYPGAHPIAVHRNELKEYSISKGTVRFTADRPLPGRLVRTLVKTRIAELSRR